MDYQQGIISKIMSKISVWAETGPQVSSSLWWHIHDDNLGAFVVGAIATPWVKDTCLVEGEHLEIYS